MCHAVDGAEHLICEQLENTEPYHTENTKPPRGLRRSDRTQMSKGSITERDIGSQQPHLTEALSSRISLTVNEHTV